jgi:hypothetical protein
MNNDLNVFDAVLISMPNAIKQEMVNIYNEYLTACVKHSRWPEDYVHSAAVVAEEAGELVQAALQHRYEKGPVSNMYTEAIQTGAMALRFMVNKPEFFCWACKRFVHGPEVSEGGYHETEEGGCGCQLHLMSNCNG